MMDKEIEGRERTLVVFRGYNGIEYKVPIYSCIDLEATGKLDCGNINCFGMRELNCDNCVFHGKSVDKDQLEFLIRGLKVTPKDKDQKKDLETKRFVEFEDDEGNNQILPMLNNTIDDGKLSCKDIDCVYHDCINCDKCPLADSWSLDPGEFEILELKSEDDE